RMRTDAKRDCAAPPLQREAASEKGDASRRRPSRVSRQDRIPNRVRDDAGGGWPARASLQLDGAAGVLDLLLDLFGLGLVHAFLDHLGGALDQRLGFG